MLFKSKQKARNVVRQKMSYRKRTITARQNTKSIIQ